MPAPEYLALDLDQPLPDLERHRRKVILVSDVVCTVDRRREVADWLVRSGCLYFIAWGIQCSQWHDEVDFANLREWGFGNVPDDAHIMTTWHSDEPLREAMWFAQHCAFHPTQELEHNLILHLTSRASPERIIGEWIRAASG